jgi:hypothetical protein
MSTINALNLRRALGRREWLPPRPFGDDGWSIVRADRTGSVIASAADFDGTTWIHASIARDEMPTYDDLVQLHTAVFGDGYAYQVFAPPSQHVNIHQHALHLWGRADGKPSMPEFGAGGTI